MVYIANTNTKMAAKMLIVILGCLMAALNVKSTEFTSTPLPGTCPDYQPQANYDNKKGSGLWYGAEIAVAGQDITVPACFRSINQEDANGALTVNAQYKTKSQTINYSITGPQDGSAPGKWTVETSLEPGKTQTLTVLATDYETYLAFVWCENNGLDEHAYITFLLSRTTDLPNQSYNEAIVAIHKAGIDTPLRTIPQKGC